MIIMIIELISEKWEILIFVVSLSFSLQHCQTKRRHHNGIKVCMAREKENEIWEDSNAELDDNMIYILIYTLCKHGIREWTIVCMHLCINIYHFAVVGLYIPVMLLCCSYFLTKQGPFYATQMNNKKNLEQKKNMFISFFFHGNLNITILPTARSHRKTISVYIFFFIECAYICILKKNVCHQVHPVLWPNGCDTHTHTNTINTESNQQSKATTTTNRDQKE